MEISIQRMHFKDYYKVENFCSLFCRDSLKIAFIRQNVIPYHTFAPTLEVVSKGMPLLLIVFKLNMHCFMLYALFSLYFNSEKCKSSGVLQPAVPNQTPSKDFDSTYQCLGNRTIGAPHLVPI